MCKVLNVSRSAYYDWLKGPATSRKFWDQKIAEQIRAVFYKSRQTYGHRWIKKVLDCCGMRVGKDRIRRVMREMKLVPIHRRKFKLTTDSSHSYPVAPNLLQRNFAAEKPRQLLVGDITYIPTDEGWLYLAAVVDLCSRRVIGWASSRRMTKELVIKALKHALTHERLAEDAVFHSDRGAQYASYDYRALLATNHIQQSMSYKGDCYDNACAESFFATLKKELIHGRHFDTRSRAQLEVLDYILWYNTERLHSSLGYCSPVDFEHQYWQASKLKAA